MSLCRATKRNGEPCTLSATDPNGYCWAHSPAHAEERKRNASRGGRGKGNPKLAKLDKQLEDLAADTLTGDVERGVAVAVNQIINTRARLVELERRLREQEELEERLAALEDVLKRRTG